ncbi:MAG: hypothetical protein JOZ08_10830 [Verrucomicrobia bacterium]|nr:hypothetical protein [Verrucomicrobiota bacterium]
MLKASGLIFSLQLVLLVVTSASAGDDLLRSKLPEDQRNALHVPEQLLVQAVKDAVREDSVQAPQITAAGVRRAIDCSTAEAVLRTVLRALNPEPSAKEFLAITRSAVHATPLDESTTLNRYGQKVLAEHCPEGLVVAAASEYPRLAWVLSDAGKQVDGKQLEGKQMAGKGVENAPTPESSPSQPNLDPILDPSLLPPAVLLPSSIGGLVPRTTP